MRQQLHELSLRENNFTYIPPEILCLTQLTSLSLASNRIHDIPEGTLSQLPNLQWLSLSNNHLTRLPKDLAKCHRLKGLDIHSNEFQSMPKVIFELKHLEVLLIQRNRIQKMPAEYAFPNKLNTLNLGFNGLDQVPRTLIDNPPKHLAHLYLSGNPLQRLAHDFLQQPDQHLVSLDLHTCMLSEIPSTFFTRPAVRRLRRLNLAINQLQHIPNEIGLLEDLEWLNLNDNRLDQLPVAIGNLTRLVKLGLVQNRLTSLPSRMFSRMQRLQKLDIRRNQLAFFPASILALAPLSEAATVEEVGVPLAVFHIQPQSTCPPTCPVATENGGSLRTLLFYENPAMDHSTGVICNDKSLLPFDRAHTLLDQSAPLPCPEQNLSLREIALRVLLSTQKMSPTITCLEHLPEKYTRMVDMFPSTRRTFLEKMVSQQIPERLRNYIMQDDTRQCDHCGQWYTDSSFQIGYLARLCMERVRVPIRFSVCSRSCALNAVVQLHNASKGWRSSTLPVLEDLTEDNLQEIPPPQTRQTGTHTQTHAQIYIYIYI
ncbi:hypothetical protein BJV82DRAFT_689257 [Fennellomyces sp. T-0311]|nr:hypothetical protein BJV82DRAFT_689257 [Fennellomyces sp. T-0311]